MTYRYSLDHEAGEAHRQRATILAEAIAALSARLDEVRLPLHVLAENHFGELNDNQEELIRTARAAADDAVSELNRLRKIADAERGMLQLHWEMVHVPELLQSLVPMLRAQAWREGIRLESRIEPDIPRIEADRARLRDALLLALTDAIRYALPGSTVTVWAGVQKGKVLVEAVHGSRHEYTGNLVLAQRLVGVQGGQVIDEDGKTRILLSAR